MNITLPRAVIEQAVEALETLMLERGSIYEQAITALRTALEQPEQEPVAHTLNCICGAVWDVSPDGVEEMVHAPNPPQRKPLTEPELHAISPTWPAPWQEWGYEEVFAFARAIEAAHGIKGDE